MRWRHAPATTLARRSQNAPTASTSPAPPESVKVLSTAPQWPLNASCPNIGHPWPSIPRSIWVRPR